MPTGVYPRKPKFVACGVYAILNTITDETYVGSSTDIVCRMHFHYNRIKRGKHGKIKIQKAIEKYGHEAFTILILETCTPETQYETEQWWFDYLHPEYNDYTIASYRNIGASPSQEMRDYFALCSKGNTNRRGAVLSKETRELMSIKRKGTKASLIARENMSRSATLAWAKRKQVL